jgi:hypothetical protein
MKTYPAKYFDNNDVDDFLDKMESAPNEKINLSEKEIAIANYFFVKELDNHTYKSGFKCAMDGFVLKFQTDTKGGTVASDEFKQGYFDGLLIRGEQKK